MLLALIGVLFVGQILYNESFVDASDNSGSKVTLTLAELMSFLGKTASTTPTNSSSSQQPIFIVPPAPAPAATNYESQFQTLKDAILSDVRSSIQDQLSSGSAANCANVMDDSCIESMANSQGADFMKYIPGKNPADYIRKDSVPCYGCSIPN